MIDVVALGEILIDFAQMETDAMGYPTLKAQPGGAPANFLAALAKYGYKTAMIGKVGDDAFGNLLINTLEEKGIDTTGVIVDDKFFTTLAFVTLDENGDRSFSFARKPGADTQLAFDEVKLDMIDQAKVFHFGTLSFTDKVSRDTTLKCLEYAKAKEKLISYDPNLRLPLWDSEEQARQAMLKGLEYADVVKISDEEISFLWNCDEKAGANIILSTYSAQIVYVTMGEKGCYYATKNYNGYVLSPEGVVVKDTTGAGDIFGGSAMRCLLQKNIPIDKLTDDDLQQICTFATAAASLSTTKPGGLTSVPEREEVERWIGR